MSADNWTYCPKCQEKARKRAELVSRLVVSDYGKIPMEKYVALMNEANRPPAPKETLREDYEIGIIDGEFFVTYAASCDVCKFEYAYKITEPIKV